MSDLVARLRHAHTHSVQRIVGSNIFEEAADEIERLRTELSETTRAAAAVVDFPATMTTEAKDGRGIVCIRFDTLADAHGFVGALVACKKLKEQAR